MTKISSMTAYARETKQAPWGELVWELRSVNHRFLDISLRLPDMLSHLEMSVREQLQMHLKRGKISASLSYIPGPQSPFQLVINQPLLQQLVLIADDVNQQFDELTIDFLQLLKWPGMVATKQTELDDLENAVLSTLNLAIIDLEATRLREGEKIHDSIKEKLDTIIQHIDMVRAQIPVVEMLQRERLQQRITELKIEVEPQRLQQEVVFYLQKIDIAEEVQRLQMHVTEMARVINEGGLLGRRLDFLVQELQRETNTMGTKAGDIVIQRAAVELKVLIEQIREQVQNIE